MSYSKGIMWLDDCRIPFKADDKFDIKRYNNSHDTFSSYEDRCSAEGKYEVNEPNQEGRFTPNLLVCDDMLNDGSIGGSSYCPPTEYQYQADNNKFNSGARRTKTGIGDKGTNSRYYDLDLWFDKMLDKL